MTVAEVEGLEDLHRLVAIESYQGNGDAKREAARFCAELLAREGFEATLDGPVDAPTVIASRASTSPDALTFYSHYDVVPPGPAAAWNSEPFTIRAADGRLYARGVSDHKATFIARLVAVRRLLARGELPVGVTFLVEGEEEIGSPSLERIITAHADQLRAKGGLYSGGARDEHGNLVIRAGAKGRCELQLSVRYSDRDNHSKWAALLPSAAWRLVGALGALYDAGTGKVLVEDFAAGVRKPTAADEEALRTLSFDEGAFLADVGYGALREDVRAEPLKALMFQPTFNLAWLASGPGGGTVLPGQATAKLDIRLVPGQTPAEMAGLVRRRLEAAGYGDIEIEARSGSEPDRCDLDDPVVEALKGACGRIDAPLAVHPLGAGSGPRYLFRKHLGYSLVQDPGCSWQGSNDHAANENIVLAHYVENCSLIEHFLQLYSRGDLGDGRRD